MKHLTTKTRVFIISSLVTMLASYSSIAFANNTDNKVASKQNILTVSSAQTITKSNDSESRKELSSVKVASIQASSQTQENKSQETLFSAKVSYKMLNANKPGSAVIYVKNKEVARYNCSASGFSPEERAKILTSRLQQFISKNGNPANIMPGLENGNPVGRAGSVVLFTADLQNAKSLGLSPSGLAIHWVNNIREALGAPKVIRDNRLIASRGIITNTFASRYLGYNQTGVASWYGGVFHGRRAADGSVFSKYEFTAAHKTLPFGTLVKVTNARNGKACVVKITDRGPFAYGRIIDVSKAAAKELGIVSSGISKVKLEVIGKY